MAKKDEETKVETYPTKVRVVSSKEGMFLVEWEDPGGDGLQRYWVTQAMVLEYFDDDGKLATVEAPERGVPYGVDWKVILPPTKTTATDLANELKRRGIWTYEDMSKNPNLVRAALSTAFGADLSSVLTAARLHAMEDNR